MKEHNQMKLRGWIFSKYRNIKDFYEAMGVSKTTMMNWFNGSVNIKEENILKIAKLLGKSENTIRKLFY